MITIVCSSINPDENYKKHVIKTCGLKNVEFIHYENKNQYSLTELYNKAISEAKFDIITFLRI